ncbi:MAG: S-formylglutathione hydrolase FrmB [Myxococcota bacterium]|jgi:S-formylglutathione hydrolase FrmB
MPNHPFHAPQGRLTHITVRSDALAGNLLGDPHERQVSVYLPKGYDEGDRDYPLLVDLAAFSSSGLKRTAWRAFEETLPQRIDRLVAEGKMGPVVLAMPDAFTRLGGNQYIDTPAVGKWATFLTQDLVPALEGAFRVRRGREHRGLFGKSSGGYGALIHGMLHAETWGAIACHSGDIGWEWGVRSGFPELCTRLQATGGDPAAWLENIWNRPTFKGSDFHCMMLLALCASYDPDPTAPYGIRLPFDPYTCEVDEVAWQRWCEHDPLVVLEREASQRGLASLKGLYIDCGDQDEYHLQYGARRFVDRLCELGIGHVWEAFSGTHRSTDPRMDVSLPYLYDALTGGE